MSIVVEKNFVKRQRQSCITSKGDLSFNICFIFQLKLSSYIDIELYIDSEWTG